jgi:hypothetical protein
MTSERRILVLSMWHLVMESSDDETAEGYECGGGEGRSGATILILLAKSRRQVSCRRNRHVGDLWNDAKYRRPTSSPYASLNHVAGIVERV